MLSPFVKGSRPNVDFYHLNESPVPHGLSFPPLISKLSVDLIEFELVYGDLCSIPAFPNLFQLLRSLSLSQVKQAKHLICTVGLFSAEKAHADFGETSLGIQADL